MSTSNTQPENYQLQFDGPRTPKRTPMDCQFCRGRKLKCDGNKPCCGNCDRRGFACQYVPVSSAIALGTLPTIQNSRGQYESPSSNPYRINVFDIFRDGELSTYTEEQLTTLCHFFNDWHSSAQGQPNPNRYYFYYALPDAPRGQGVPTVNTNTFNPFDNVAAGNYAEYNVETRAAVPLRNVPAGNSGVGGPLFAPAVGALVPVGFINGQAAQCATAGNFTSNVGHNTQALAGPFNNAYQGVPKVPLRPANANPGSAADHTSTRKNTLPQPTGVRQRARFLDQAPTNVSAVESDNICMQVIGWRFYYPEEH